MKTTDRVKIPAVGIGYRSAIDHWTRANLHCFDLLEVTVDHCIHGDPEQREAIFDLANSLPINAHGVGLSIGTDSPLDLEYLDKVADIVERLRAPTYSEHLAFTRAGGLELANLLPLPKTEDIAEAIVGKVKTVRSRVAVPFLLENISYVFEWPDSKLSDAEFLNLICREANAGLLLDLENLYLNASNHGFDAFGFIDALTQGVVKEIHLAGGVEIVDTDLSRPFMADSHSHPVPESVLNLLDHALGRHSPSTIILERDDRFDALEEVLTDITRIRARLAEQHAPATDNVLVG